MAGRGAGFASTGERPQPASVMPRSGRLTLFLCGDVMTGRGIDQALPHPVPPHLYEPFVTSALDYVELAEEANGPIPRPVPFDGVWGAALDVLDAVRPDVRIINLETSITTSETPELKEIHYRMAPANAPVLGAAGIDCCVLANNHVLDWGRAGLIETLDTLAGAGIRSVGAGRDLDEARAPVAIDVDGGARVLVIGLGSVDSGIPAEWAAGPERPGVHLLTDYSDRAVQDIAGLIDEVRRPGDVVVASIHWGPNWGFEIPDAHRRFAHALIDRAGVDVVHGHSSHHVKAIEVYRDRPIFYGCGDFLNDHEGIRGYEEFRGDLVLMYFPSFDLEAGRLERLAMVPLRIRNFRLVHPTRADREWLLDTLDRECGRFGHRAVEREGEIMLERTRADG